MLEIIITLLIGAFIGWNLPQPDFLKSIQAKVLSFFTKKTSS
jgi:hypothetical protein